MFTDKTIVTVDILQGKYLIRDLKLVHYSTNDRLKIIVIFANRPPIVVYFLSISTFYEYFEYDYGSLNHLH